MPINQQNKNTHFINAPELPAGLFHKIIARIKEEHRLMSIRRRIFVFSSLSIISIVTLIPIFNWTHQSFSETGFFQFLSLIFTDTSVVLAYWKSFVMTLTESFPIISATVFLAAFAILLTFLKSLAKNIKVVFSYKRLIKLKLLS
jgi:3'-phosphoadenosine 5'-phosphosulfate sulfotransferase (PAPS reductase)/FAD synthetase